MVEIEFAEILQAVIKFVLTVFALITAGIANPPPPGTFVSEEPSPTNLAKIVPAEIVEKKPYPVDNEFVEILQAVSRPVLKKVVLSTGGTMDIPPPPLIPVREEPSPMNLP